jgi:hypothetical protein
MKKFIIALKRFFIIFSVCFSLLFMLFSVDAIVSITRYKLKHWKENLLYGLRRPISFNTDIDTKVFENIQNKLEVNQLIIFREPLPAIPVEAMSQDLLVLPKFDIKAPI